MVQGGVGVERDQGPGRVVPFALVLIAALAATPASEPDGTGAPSLQSVARYWTMDRLADHLVDPAKVIASDPRLKARAAKPLDERQAVGGTS